MFSINTLWIVDFDTLIPLDLRFIAMPRQEHPRVLSSKIFSVGKRNLGLPAFDMPTVVKAPILHLLFPLYEYNQAWPHTQLQLDIMNTFNLSEGYVSG